jgi:very-short-patch-repair endonuclease
MTKIFNRYKEKEKRRQLRLNMTKAEVLLWLELKNKKVLEQRFLRQFSIGSYVLDFYCPKLKIAIEVDGATHLTDEEIEYDKYRQSQIEDLGIKVLRFKNYEIYNDRSNIIGEIKNEIEKIL